MLPLLVHVFQFAEVYTVVLAWVVIPLVFLASYVFFQTHYGLFQPSAASQTAPEEPLKPVEVKTEEHLDGAA